MDKVLINRDLEHTKRGVLGYVSEKERGKGVGFERIRRITGYLVGDMSRWNNAKKCEERDRVRHMV